jgi:hypothetical protein
MSLASTTRSTPPNTFCRDLLASARSLGHLLCAVYRAQRTASQRPLMTPAQLGIVTFRWRPTDKSDEEKRTREPCNTSQQSRSRDKTISYGE